MFFKAIFFFVKFIHVEFFSLNLNTEKKKKRVITLVNFKRQFCQFQRFAKLVLLL